MKRLLSCLALIAPLAGCAVYEPPGYVAYPANGYSYAQGTYPPPQTYSTAPVYAAPVYAAPVYVGPPVSFSFGYFWHGGGHGGGWHRH